MALSFNTISFAYGTLPVLSELSLSVEPGEITCLLGASGCGKSTLLRLAAGLEHVQSGSIDLNGKPLASPNNNPPPEKRPVGLMFQENALFPHLTVDENIAFGLSHLSVTEQERRVKALLEMVGLVEFGARYPHQLSGGQQQRIALARAIAPQPEVLLMDEPYASIDVTLRRSLREAARQLIRKNRTTTILVTHDPDEAMEMADVIAILDEGRIVQQGSPESLFDSPEAASVAALFGSAERLQSTFDGRVFNTDYGSISVGQSLDGSPQMQSRKTGTWKKHNELVIRPDGLLVEPCNDSATSGESALACPAIADIRYVGSEWLLFLKPLNAEDREVESTGSLRVAVADRADWAIGDRVALTARDKNFFVFPRS